MMEFGRLIRHRPLPIETRRQRSALKVIKPFNAWARFSIMRHRHYLMAGDGERFLGSRSILKNAVRYFTTTGTIAVTTSTILIAAHAINRSSPPRRR